MARVFFYNLPPRFEESFLRKTVSGVLKKEARNDQSVSCIFVNEKEMAGLNRYYRGKNLPTDVLSFEQDDPVDRYLGEVVVCLAFVRKNARRFHRSFKEELKRILIHGTLHLLGYDHEGSLKEEKLMTEKQEKYLSIACGTPHDIS